MTLCPYDNDPHENCIKFCSVTGFEDVVKYKGPEWLEGTLDMLLPYG